jgi:hypothetical protein
MAATFSAIFIDDEYLKTYSPLGKSIDVDEIYPFVENSQDIYIQDVLGTPLYIDLTYKLFTGVTYSSMESQLVDICSKSLCYWTVYMALPHLYLRIRNAGVVKSQSENTQNSDLNELKYLKEEMKNLATFWNQRVVSFLCDNSTSFPLYNAASNDIYPSNTQYDSDIYIDPSYSDLTYDELKFLKKYLG